MFLQKRMNRKGDETSPISAVVAVIVVVIVAVVVIMFYTGSFAKIAEFFSSAPPAVEGRITSCQAAADLGRAYTYCDQFEAATIRATAQIVNCQYPAIESKLQVSTPIQCTAIDVNGKTTAALDYTERGSYYCGALFRSGQVKSDTRVNDIVCSSLKCASLYLGGELVQGTATSCGNRTDGKTKAITTSFGDATAGSVCCVKS